LEGTGHIQRSEQLKAQLLRESGMRDWYVMHEQGASLIYHGFYTEIDSTVTDKAAQIDAARARRDRQQVEAMELPGTGKRIFPRAVMVKLDSPDPDAPPEWNLANSPGYWTVQIAAYANSPERKRTAVDAVRAAREQGIEAYYYHGDNYSSVCIGSFGVDAVKETEVFLGNTSDDASIIVSNMNLPDSLVGMRDSEGKAVAVRKDKVEIFEPRIRQLLETYREHSTNGLVDMVTVTDPQTQKKRQVARPSLLVRIPRDLRDVGQADGQQDVPQLLDPSGRQNQNLGTRLKTLGQ